MDSDFLRLARRVKNIEEAQTATGGTTGIDLEGFATPEAVNDALVEYAAVGKIEYSDYATLNTAYKTLKAGIYCCSNGPNGWCHIINLPHANTDGHGSQVRIDYFTTGNMYFRSSSGGTFSNWHLIWHADNDGSGSGLDADYLDGSHASVFPRIGSIGNGDMNAAVTSGMYRFDNPTNKPDVNYGQLIVAHGAGDTILQIASDYYSGNLFWRSGNPPQAGGTGSWGGWCKIHHDGFIQFRTGQCTLNTSSEVWVSFSSPLPNTPGAVMITPQTTTSGVIAGKVRGKANTGFTAIIGGSGFSGIVFDYIAIWLG